MSKTYAEKLRHPNWQKRRLQIMELDYFRCRHCCSKDVTLNVHHLYYRKGADPWDYDDDALITLCENCHERCHSANWKQAFLDLNLSELDLLDIALQIKFKKKKFEVLTADILQKYKCRVTDTMYIDFFNSAEEVDEYYRSFMPEMKIKYTNG